MRTKRFVGFRQFEQRPCLEKLEDRLVLASLADLADPSLLPDSYAAAMLNSANAEAESSSLSQNDLARASQAVNRFAFDLYRQCCRGWGCLRHLTKGVPISPEWLT